MKHNDEITQRLEELLEKHPEFRKLSMNDPTVYSWLKTAMTYENRDYVGSAEEILVGIIVALGRDKQELFDDSLERIKSCTCNARKIRL